MPGYEVCLAKRFTFFASVWKIDLNTAQISLPHMPSLLQFLLLVIFYLNQIKSNKIKRWWGSLSRSYAINCHSQLSYLKQKHCVIAAIKAPLYSREMSSSRSRIFLWLAWFLIRFMIIIIFWRVTNSLFAVLSQAVKISYLLQG